MCGECNWDAEISTTPRSRANPLWLENHWVVDLRGAEYADTPMKGNLNEEMKAIPKVQLSEPGQFS